tara:strand:+ start:74 stop:343 length:270 start_codon:yes stop_codon:yes gene_type:complete
MLIKLIEVCLHDQRSSTRELYVNASNIVSISKEVRPRVIEETKVLGFSNLTVFSTIVINEGASTKVITVAHSPDEIQKRIKSSKSLLKG